jgi:hypothetical protein
MELPSHIDPRYIVRVLRTLRVEGDVVEARLLGVHNAGHISGYFDNLEQLASAVARYDGRAEATYLTLNPVQPALLARGVNRLIEWAKHTTSDADIVCRRSCGGSSLAACSKVGKRSTVRTGVSTSSAG